MAKIFCVHNSLRALAYVRSQLECGGSLLKRVHGVLESGSLFFIVPDACPDEVEDHPFERGFAVNSGSGAADVQSVRPTDAALEVLASLSSEADWLVADAHHLAPRDPVVQRSHLPVRTFESDVYLVGAMTEERDYLRSLILRGSSAWYGAAMLARSPIPGSSADGDRWTDADLATLASKMRALLVRAYDQEGYVLWVSRECKATDVLPNIRRAPDEIGS